MTILLHQAPYCTQNSDTGSPRTECDTHRSSIEDGNDVMERTRDMRVVSNLYTLLTSALSALRCAPSICHDIRSTLYAIRTTANYCALPRGNTTFPNTNELATGRHDYAGRWRHVLVRRGGPHF